MWWVEQGEGPGIIDYNYNTFYTVHTFALSSLTKVKGVIW